MVLLICSLAYLSNIWWYVSIEQSKILIVPFLVYMAVEILLVQLVIIATFSILRLFFMLFISYLILLF